MKNHFDLLEAGDTCYQVLYTPNSQNKVTIFEVKILEDDLVNRPSSYHSKKGCRVDGSIVTVVSSVFNKPIEDINKLTNLGPYYFTSLSEAEKVAETVWKRAKDYLNHIFNPLAESFSIFSQDSKTFLSHYNLNLEEKLTAMEFAKENKDKLDGYGDLFYEVGVRVYGRKVEVTTIISQVQEVEFDEEVLDEDDSDSSGDDMSPLEVSLEIFTYRDKELEHYEVADMTLVERQDYYEYWYINNRVYHFSHYLYLNPNLVKSAEDLMKYIQLIYNSKYDYISKEYFRIKEKLSYFGETYSLSEIEYSFFE